MAERGGGRLAVRKTYKLFIGGAFPRSESGRTYEAQGMNVARASRKDVRDAVQAARGAQPKWGNATAYNRGQVLYRIAEMMEARVPEFAALCSGKAEVEYWAARVKPGTILFEIAGVPEASAKKALVRVAMKMPVKCRFVGRRLTV